MKILFIINDPPTGAGALKGCGHAFHSACDQKRQRVSLPRLIIEAGNQEPTGLVGHQRTNTCDERLKFLLDWRRPVPEDRF